MTNPIIVPHKTKQYQIKQSKYNVPPTLPFKSIIYAPSNSGKTVLITNLIENIYRDAFERIYIFSPSISVDGAWKSTKRYLNEAIPVGDNEPSLYQENFDESIANEIMTTQKKITDHIKKNKESNRLLSILIVLDDVADDTSQRNSKALKSLFVKGRHSHISIILSSQKGSIIFDVKCSNALPEVIKDLGGNPIMSPTGHFHIKNGIKKHNPLLAGEMSGHIFFNDKWYGFDDGHYSGARIIELIWKRNESISEINEKLPKSFSTPELNIDVTDEIKFKIIEDFSSQCSLEGEKITIDGLRINFDDGWGLLRASNTTPKLVLRFEGDSMDSLNKIKNDFLNELSRICPDIDINLV